VWDVAVVEAGDDEKGLALSRLLIFHHFTTFAAILSSCFPDRRRRWRVFT
jgi:hypothetical protein